LQLATEQLTPHKLSSVRLALSDIKIPSHYSGMILVFPVLIIIYKEVGGNMSLYAMSDFHLCVGVKDKPMDIFGDKWVDYINKIYINCNKILNEDDLLLIPGDISWATYKDQAIDDLRFINNLPGKKIISKGNHDYWWTTAKKLSELKTKYNLNTIEFLKNNYFSYNNTAICGNRGWTLLSNEEEDIKIYNRELNRLELSLESANKAGFNNKIVMTHYPPLKDKYTPDENVLSLLLKYNVTHCIFGHLHNLDSNEVYKGVYDGIEFNLVSSDYLNFTPTHIL